MEKKENFHYTYSAKEQAEIQRIREKYTTPPKEEDQMALLRRLDAGVYSKANAAALIVGLVGVLLMGLGMSLVMTELGALLGTVLSMAVGVGVGMAGIVLICLAYPIYNRTLKKEREKVAPEILRLSDLLMK